MKIKLLYGSEFWYELEALCKIAEKRAIFASAYVKLNTVNKYRAMLGPDVSHYLICRDDNRHYNIPTKNVVKVNNKYFHGKIYLIDNVVIIGSQNLYDANKEGEFSVLFELEASDASTIFYQSLIKIIEDYPVKAEPVHPSIMDLYDEKSECPFCSNNFSDPESIHHSPGYGNGSGFVSNDDCELYDGEGACQWCLEENRTPIPDALVCDDSGCGFGINTDSFTLMYHAINAPSGEKKKKALEFLRLYNFIHLQLDKDTKHFFRSLDLVGKVYQTSLNREAIDLVMYHSKK